MAAVPLAGSAPRKKENRHSFSFKKPLALESFLKRHPEIEEIEICTNNDFAGRWAAEHLEKPIRASTAW